MLRGEDAIATMTIVDDGAVGKSNANSVAQAVEMKFMLDSVEFRPLTIEKNIAARKAMNSTKVERGGNSRDTIKARRKKLAQHLLAPKLGTESRPVTALDINGVTMTPVYHE